MNNKRIEYLVKLGANPCRKGNTMYLNKTENDPLIQIHLDINDISEMSDDEWAGFKKRLISWINY